MWRFIALFLTLTCSFVSAAKEARAGLKPGVRSPITFKESTPVAGDEQLKLRLHNAEDPAPYDLSREQFEVLVPKSYKDSTPYGLFVWISPGDKPNLSPEWDKVLADKKLIFIGAFRSGNNREVLDRMRLAIDANDNMRQLFTIDPKRVYISGHSGGARVASMLAVAYADMFSGAACFMGVNYFRNLAAPDGTVFEMRYLPNPEIGQIAVTESHIALITGEKDFNRTNTKTLYDLGFMKDEFQHVKLFDIPGQAHSAPSADWLEKVIEFLDKGK